MNFALALPNWDSQQGSSFSLPSQRNFPISFNLVCLFSSKTCCLEVNCLYLTKSNNQVLTYVYIYFLAYLIQYNFTTLFCFQVSMFPPKLWIRIFKIHLLPLWLTRFVPFLLERLASEPSEPTPKATSLQMKAQANIKLFLWTKLRISVCIVNPITNLKFHISNHPWTRNF